MGDDDIVHDAACATALAVVELFDWDREEQMDEAFREVVRVVEAGIQAAIDFVLAARSVRSAAGNPSAN